jgi:hypothetical protein
MKPVAKIPAHTIGGKTNGASSSVANTIAFIVSPKFIVVLDY